MERLNADVRAVKSALEQAPEVLDAVRVDTTIDVPLCVVDDLVRELAVEAGPWAGRSSIRPAAQALRARRCAQPAG